MSDLMNSGVLPPIGDDEEYVLYILQSNAPSVAASSRGDLDSERLKNTDHPFFVTTLVFEETTAQELADLDFDLTDTKRNRRFSRNPIDPTGATVVSAPNSVTTMVQGVLDLKRAYEMAPNSSLAVNVTNNDASSARTPRLTVIGYQRLKRI